MPRDAWNRRADRACHKHHRLSLLHARRDETLHEFRRDHLLLLDYVKIALAGGLAGLVSSDAGHHTGIGATHVRDHQRIIAGLVHEDLVSQIVGDLLAVYKPSDLGVWTAGNATIESEKLNLLFLLIINYIHVETS